MQVDSASHNNCHQRAGLSDHQKMCAIFYCIFNDIFFCRCVLIFFYLHFYLTIFPYRENDHQIEKQEKDELKEEILESKADRNESTRLEREKKVLYTLYLGIHSNSNSNRILTRLFKAIFEIC